MTYHFRQHIDQMKLGEFPSAAVPHKMTFVNGKSAYTVASPPPPVSSGCLHEPESTLHWEAPWNRVPLPRRGFETNFKCTSTAQASPASCVTRRPQELRREEQRGVIRRCQGGAACGAHSLRPRAGTGNPEPHLHCPGRRGFRRDPPSPQTSGGGRHSGRPRGSHLPAAPCRGGRRHTHPRWAPPNTAPRRPLEPPIRRGQRSPRGTPRGGCPESPRPQLRT